MAAVGRMDEKEQRGKGSFLISGEPIRGLETEKGVRGLRLGVHLPVIVHILGVSHQERVKETPKICGIRTLVFGN